MKTKPPLIKHYMLGLALVITLTIFAWVLFIPDNSRGLISYSLARQIIRSGCAASIDDTRQKMRHLPYYLLAGRAHRIVPLLLGTSLLVTWLNSFRYQYYKQKNKKQTWSHLYRFWTLSYYLTSPRRPPPYTYC